MTISDEVYTRIWNETNAEVAIAKSRFKRTDIHWNTVFERRLREYRKQQMEGESK